jgi:hypothetical protein
VLTGVVLDALLMAQCTAMGLLLLSLHIAVAVLLASAHSIAAAAVAAEIATAELTVYPGMHSYANKCSHILVHCALLCIVSLSCRTVRLSQHSHKQANCC